MVHFLNNLLDDLIKNLGKNHFHHVNQEFNANELNLVQKRRFFPQDNLDSFEKFKEGIPSKDNFCNTVLNHVISHKNYEHVLKVWDNFNITNVSD